MENQIVNQARQRNTAYKVWVGDIFKGNLSLDEQRFNFVEINNLKVVRVNIIANVVDKYISDAKPFASLTIDDSTGQIKVKTFEDVDNLNAFNVGQTVGIIGNLRYFNNEVYILPEIIKRLDEKWLLARKLELGTSLKDVQTQTPQARTQQTQKIQKPKQEIKQEPQKTAEEKIQEERIELPAEEQQTEQTSLKDVIINYIKKDERGAEIDKLIMSLNHPVSDINNTISELIEDGTIYEPQPGLFRII